MHESINFAQATEFVARVITHYPVPMQRYELESIVGSASPQFDDALAVYTNHPIGAEHIGVAVEAEHKYPYKKGVLASKISSNFEGVIEHSNDSDLSINLLQPDSWFLCDDGEARMEEAIGDGALMAVNESLVVKFVGRLVAYCTEDTVTKNGTFISGNWYTPVGDEIRDRLKVGFDSSLGSVKLQNGSWLLLREADEGFRIKYGPELYRWATEIEEMLPEKIQGVDRRTYRIKKRESINS